MLRLCRLCACCVVLACVSLRAFAQSPSTAPPALVSPAPVPAKHGMVVSIQHDASDAGLEMLRQGGNAVDAAVAVGFALAVTYPQAGNLGGGGFMLVRMHTGRAHFIDYREEAPAAASADMYLDASKNVVPGMSTSTLKAVGIPGTVAGLAYAEKTYGKLGLAGVMAPAIRLATDGYILPEEERIRWRRAVRSRDLLSRGICFSAMAIRTRRESGGCSLSWRRR